MKDKSKKPSKASSVLFASIKTMQPSGDATLPAKFERMLAEFDMRSMFDGNRVPIKMHLGGAVGFTTIHPRLIRIVVQAVKKAGGQPFVVDGYFDSVIHAAERGYTSETLGCPIVSAGGPLDSHVVPVRIGFRALDEVNIFGAIRDAKCMINLSHVKGHGDCGYGGACKNIAMGCVDASTRGKIHSLEGGIRWEKSKCTFCGRCVKACDTGAITLDKKGKNVSIFFHNCRYCRHCVSACPQDALDMSDAKGFRYFQEGMALTTKAVLDSFPAGKVLHINVLTNITQLCDCWGFSTASMVPDIGIMASQDMVALETACLDAIKVEAFIPGSLIGKMQLGEGAHLLEKVHGKDPYIQVREMEKQGIGRSAYAIKEIK
ncbi:MAG TPA: DUF362 domain-containing protein [Candidatus Brocadiia bacterium]|nr:DUF362 domain-containing protein [Candidatus Brocadiia bacterium]